MTELRCESRAQAFAVTPSFAFLDSFSDAPPACEILVHLPEIEVAPPMLEPQSLNHWTIREVTTFV